MRENGNQESSLKACSIHDVCDDIQGEMSSRQLGKGERDMHLGALSRQMGLKVMGMDE